jgi:hypothetical protein
MVFAILLLCLLALLVGFLIWRKVPRQHLFSILLIASWVYGLSFFLTLRAVNAVAPSLIDGFVPYFPPVIPVGVFVAWALHRVKAIEELNTKV